jgi:hypothetical protein
MSQKYHMNWNTYLLSGMELEVGRQIVVRWKDGSEREW